MFKISRSIFSLVYPEPVDGALFIPFLHTFLKNRDWPWWLKNCGAIHKNQADSPITGSDPGDWRNKEIVAKPRTTIPGTSVLKHAKPKPTFANPILQNQQKSYSFAQSLPWTWVYPEPVEGSKLVIVIVIIKKRLRPIHQSPPTSPICLSIISSNDKDKS